jgi:cell division protein FtsN
LPRSAADDAGVEGAAAETLDSGLAPGTTAERAPEPASGAERSAGPYALQVGAFTDATAAGRRAEEARALAAGLPVEIVRLDGWLKVFLGSFATREDAEATLRDLAARGLGPAWVTRRVP